MLRTITTGSCISVQGEFLENLFDGQIAVQVGKMVFVGRPILQSSQTPLKSPAKQSSSESILSA
jgi:hypothetical protein